MNARRTTRLAGVAGLALAATVWLHPAAATPAEVDALKVAYLRCEAEAAARLLQVDEAAACSLVHERLLRVAFDGDWARLLAWWRAERAAARQRERPNAG